MTYSNYKKALKQLKAKPVKLKKFLKHNAPKKRSCGVSLKRCGRCGRKKGQIKKLENAFDRVSFSDIFASIIFLES